MTLLQSSPVNRVNTPVFNNKIPREKFFFSIFETFNLMFLAQSIHN